MDIARSIGKIAASLAIIMLVIIGVLMLFGNDSGAIGQWFGRPRDLPQAIFDGCLVLAFAWIIAR